MYEESSSRSNKMKLSLIAAVVLSLLVSKVEAHSLVADGFKEEKSSLRGGNVGKILVRKNTSCFIFICLCHMNMLSFQSSTAHGYLNLASVQ
jgi:methionine-rich copper-binding protein CopC